MPNSPPMTPDQKLEAPTDFYARNPGAQPFRGRLIEMRSQEDLLRGAFFQMKHMRQWRGRQLWTLVGAITGHGSGYSQQICEELGWRYDMDITPASHLPTRATPAPTRTNTGAERNAGFLRSQCSSEKPPYGRRPGHAVVEISVDQAEEIAALLSRPSPAPTAPGESDEVVALRAKVNELSDKLFDGDNCHSADHQAALAYFGQAMEHDGWKRERDALREQLAELRAQNMVYDSVAVDREQECIALREQLAGVTRERDDILALSEPWPLRDVLDKLRAATRHLLDVHGCDAHGHEEYKAAMMQAETLIVRIDTALTASAAEGET